MAAFNVWFHIGCFRSNLARFRWFRSNLAGWFWMVSRQ